MDADTCMTECQVSTDLHTHHLDDGLDDFVHDEAHNEKGGEQMMEAHNEQAKEEVMTCTPTVDIEKEPEFADLDTNQDDKIDGDEAAAFFKKSCIPDEIGKQIFDNSDLNMDGSLDENEWNEAGEDSTNEQAMDGALEDVSAGDDEYNPVQNAPLEEFDENKDGALDNSEAHEMFEHELERRTEHEEVPAETMSEIEPKIQEAIDKVDTNKDGDIDGDEYVAEGSDSDLGTEIVEASGNDEDKKELDDLSRATSLLHHQSRRHHKSPHTKRRAPAAAAASLLHHQTRHHHKSHHAHFLHKHKVPKRKTVKYGRAIMELARERQWVQRQNQQME
jgi:hypothetical protein